MTWKILNAVGYQLVWLISVASAAGGHLWIGPLAAVAFAIVVLAFGGHRGADLRLIPLAVLIGALADSAWIELHWIDYRAPWPFKSLAPGWIIGLWLAFAMTLNHSLGFLKSRYALAAIFGAIGGPLAYWGAARGFGALHFDASIVTVLLGLSVAWAALVALLVWLAARLGVSQTRLALP